MERVSFRHLAESTKADHDMLQPYLEEENKHTADRVLEMFALLKDKDCGPLPVDIFAHGLQTATLALQDGADEETIVCALLHDIGHYVAPMNHGRFIAELLQPFISEENYWVLQHHTVFQAYYYLHYIGKDRNARDQYKDSPYYDQALRFVERWDQKAFDPQFKPEPIETFGPMVRRIFARPPHSTGAKVPLSAAVA
jgi:predicted HD phosphohydrolase